MIDRPFWRQRIDEAWRQAPIAWLCGVRRCGKTTLAQSLGDARVLYLNCDYPEVEEMVRDPQLFFRGCAKPNYLVVPSAETAYAKGYGNLRVTVCTPSQLRP